MNLSKQLKLFMDNESLNLTTLSKKSGVAKSTLSGWLNGVTPRDLESVRKVCTAFNNSPSVDLMIWGNGLSEKKKTIEDYNDEINAGVFEVVLRRVKG